MKLMASEWAKTKVLSTSDSAAGALVLRPPEPFEARRELIQASRGRLSGVSLQEAGYFPTELHCSAKQDAEQVLDGRGWARKGICRGGW